MGDILSLARSLRGFGSDRLSRARYCARMSTKDELPPPLPTVDPDESETDLGAYDTALDPTPLEALPPTAPKPAPGLMEPPALGGDLSGMMAVNDDETDAATLAVTPEEAQAMRDEARIRALPAPPHPSADLALKTKEQVEQEEEAAVQAMLKGEDPKPPAPASGGEVVKRSTPGALKGLLIASGIWNIISGLIWVLGIVTAPIAIGCWIVAFFEFRLAIQADDLDVREVAERAKTISYVEMSELIWAMGFFTFGFGVAIQIYARKLLDENP